MKDLFGNELKTNILIGKGEDILTPFITPKISLMILPLYDNFNQITFDNIISVPNGFEKLCNLIYNVFGNNPPIIKCLEHEKIKLNKNCKDVILAFSGGLDSCYQAILLKENGYNVHLFHVKGINVYEGGIQVNAVKSFADKIGCELIYAKFKRKGKRNINKYYPRWSDNPIKNQLILSIMIDICNERGYNIISLGDDESISVFDSDAKCGINITDCKEIQNGFIEAINGYCENLKYVGINRDYKNVENNKYLRLINVFRIIEYNII